MTLGSDNHRLRSYIDYLCLSDAASLIGRQLVDGWQDSDIECSDDEPDGRARAERVRKILRDLLSGGRLPAFGWDDEGAYDEISRNRLSKPFFDVDVVRSLFRWSPEDWAPIFVSKTGLQGYIAEISDIKPRQSKTYRWQDITNAAWRLALDNLHLRETKRLIGAVQDAFIVQYDGKPDDKELRGLVNEIIGFLGSRTLSREVSSKETSSDTPPDTV